MNRNTTLFLILTFSAILLGIIYVQKHSTHSLEHAIEEINHQQQLLRNQLKRSYLKAEYTLEDAEYKASKQAGEWVDSVKETMTKTKDLTDEKIQQLRMEYYKNMLSTIGYPTVTESVKDKTKEGYDYVKDTLKEGKDKAKEGFEYTKDTMGEGYDYAKDKAKEGFDYTKDTLKEGKDKTKEGIDYTKDTMAEGYDYAKDKAKKGYEYAKDTMEEGIDYTKDTMTEGYDYAKDKAEEGYDYTKDTLKEGKDKMNQGYDYLKEKTEETKNRMKDNAIREGEKVRDDIASRKAEEAYIRDNSMREGVDTMNMEAKKNYHDLRDYVKEKADSMSQNAYDIGKNIKDQAEKRYREGKEGLKEGYNSRLKEEQDQAYFQQGAL